MQGYRVLNLGLSLLCFACGEDEFGEGTRRPPTTLVPRADPLPLAISEVAFGPDAFVEIENRGGEDIDLETLRADGDGPSVVLVSNLGQVALTGTVETGQRRVFDDDAEAEADVIGALLSTSSGELAVRDSTGVVHAYVAWGGSPAGRASVLYGEAFSSGLALPTPPQLPAPYPVDPGQALVFGSERGCAAPSPGTAAPSVSPCPPGSGQLLLTEVLAGAAAALTWIEVQNPGPESLPLKGVRVCRGASCAPVLESTGPIGAGERAVVLVGVSLNEARSLPVDALGALGSDDGLACGEGFTCASVGLSPLTGPIELSIARPGDSGATGDELLSYLRAGEGATSVLEADAIAAALWSSGTVALPPGDTQSLQRSPEAVPGPAGWSAATATPGAALP